MKEERTKKILLTIIKHCNIIEETKQHYETIDKLILWNVADKEIEKVKKFCSDVLK